MRRDLRSMVQPHTTCYQTRCLVSQKCNHVWRCRFSFGMWIIPKSQLSSCQQSQVWIGILPTSSLQESVGHVRVTWRRCVISGWDLASQRDESLAWQGGPMKKAYISTSFILISNGLLQMTSHPGIILWHASLMRWDALETCWHVPAFGSLLHIDSNLYESRCSIRSGNLQTSEFGHYRHMTQLIALRHPTSHGVYALQPIPTHR